MSRTGLGERARARSGSAVADGKSGGRHNVSFATAMLAGLVERREVRLPEAVGEDHVFGFLEVSDVLVVRAVSTQMLHWAEIALARREKVALEAGETMDLAALEAVLERCPLAAELRLRGCAGLAAPAGWSPLPGLSASLRDRLTTLVLRCDAGRQAEVAPVVVGVARACERLERVESNAMSDAALLALQSSSACLRELCCAGAGARVSGGAVVALVASCKRLERLSVPGCAVGDAHLETLASRVRLVALDVSHCRDVRDADGRHVSEMTEAGVAVAVRRLRGLRELRVAGLYPEGSLLDALAERGKPMHVLELGDCPHLRSATPLLAALRVIGRGLRVLRLTGCRQVSDLGGLCQLPALCPDVEELALGRCEGVSDLVLAAIADNCRRLKDLDLQRCSRVSDAGLASLLQGCEQLESIDLSGCSLVTDRSLDKLAACTALRRVALFCCSAITGEGLEAAARRPGSFARLQAIDLSWCFRISATAAAELARSAPALRAVFLEGMEHWTATDLSGLRSVRPGLTLKRGSMQGPCELAEAALSGGLPSKPKRSTSLGGEPSGRTSPRERLVKKGSSHRLLLHHPSGVSPIHRRHTVTGVDEAELAGLQVDVPRLQCKLSHRRKSSMSAASAVPATPRLSMDELERIAATHDALDEAHLPPVQAPAAVARRARNSGGSWGRQGVTLFARSAGRMLGKKAHVSRSCQPVPASPEVGGRRFGDAPRDLDRLGAFAAIH